MAPVHRIPSGREESSLSQGSMMTVVVRHGKAPHLMSALGQKRTLGKVRLMSALPPKADMDRRAVMSALCQKRTYAVQQNSGYSITSSARATSDCGTASPSAFAVLRLTVSTYLVGAWTGRSAGLVPLRILSTYSAARRNWSSQSRPYDNNPPAATLSASA